MTTMTRSEADELWAAHLASPTSASQEALARHYWRLVHSMAVRAQREIGFPREVSYDDICGDAMEGFLSAVRLWDPEKGPFIPYLARRVRGAIIDGQRRMDHLSRRERGRRDHTEARWAAPFSLDVALPGIDDEDDRAVSEFMPITDEGFEEIELADWLHQGIERLRKTRPVHVEVLHRRMAGGALAEIAAQLGVTESRISQMISEAQEVVMGHRDAPRGRAKQVPAATVDAKVSAVLAEVGEFAHPKGRALAELVAATDYNVPMVTRSLGRLEVEGLVEVERRTMRGTHRITWIGAGAS